MAEKKKSNSLGMLSAAAIITPTAIGATKTLELLADESKANLAINVNAAASKVEQAVQRHSVRSVQQYTKHLDFLRNYMGAFDSKEGLGLIQESLTRASSTLRGEAQFQMGQLMQSVSAAENIQDVVSAFNAFSNKYPQSKHVGALRRFHSNLEKVSGVYRETRSLDFMKTFAPVGIELKGQTPSVVPDFLGRFSARIKSTLGATSTLKEFQRSRTGASARMFVSTVHTEIGDLNIRVPTVEGNGLIYEGPTFNTSYIHSYVGVVDPKTGKMVDKMTRPEFFLQEVESGVLGRIQSGEITSLRDAQRAVEEVRARTIYSLEHIQAEGGLSGNAGAYANVKSDSIALVKQLEEPRGPGKPWKVPSSFAPLSAQERELALRAGTAYGGTSPSQVSKSVLMSRDPGSFTLFSDSAEYGKKPLANFRVPTLTRESKETLRSLNMLNQGLTMRARNTGFELPSVPYAFVDLGDPRVARLAKQAGMQEGESLISARILNEVSFSEQKNMHMSEVVQDYQNVKEGGFLGWSDQGTAIMRERNMANLRMVEHSKSGKTYVKLVYDRIQGVSGKAKFFDLKTMTYGVPDKVLRSFGAGNRRGVHGVASLDYLRKSPQRLFSQIATGMQDILQEKIGSGQQVSQAAKTFAHDPEAILKMMRQARVDPRTQTATVRELMSFGMKYGNLSPEEFGKVFGALPKIMNESEWGSTSEDLVATLGRKHGVPVPVVREYMNEMRRQNPVGRVLLSYKGREVTGRLGSIESRMFDILQQHGGAGRVLSNEIYGRLQVTNPEKFALSAELRKSLGSWTGDIAPQKGEAITQIGGPKRVTSEAVDQFMKTGGWVQAGENTPFYVPSSDILSSQIAPSSSGNVFDTDLERLYKNLVTDTDAMTALSGGETAATQELIDATMGEVWRQASPAGKGMAGTLSGKLAGSRNLLAMSPTDLRAQEGLPKAFQRDLFYGQTNRVVVSRDAMLGMLDDMSGQFGEEFTDTMRARLEAGKGVPVLGWRHPTIGPASAQPLVAYMGDIPNGSVMVPSKELSVMAKVGSKVQKQTVSISPLVGFAADFDADTINIMMMGPESQAVIKRTMLKKNSEFSARYLEHQVRMQLLKPGRVSNVNLGMSLRETMTAGTQQGAIVEDYIGKLSTTLTGIKRSVLRYSSGKQAAEALSLLEWIEQNPISAKHIALKDIGEGKLQNFLESHLTPALDMADSRPDLLRSAIKEMTAGSDVGSALLGEGVEITNADILSKELGQNIPSRIAGTDVDQAITTIARSLKGAKDEGFLQQERLFSGRAKATADTVSQLLAEDRLTEIGTRSLRGAASGAEEAAGVLIRNNKAVKQGLGILEHYKPLALGFAASIGIATLLAQPLRNVGSGKDTVPTFDPSKIGEGRAAQGMTPEGLTQGAAPTGVPTHPPIFAWGRGMMRSGAPVSRSIGTSANSAQEAETMGRVIAEQSGTQYARITLRDSRSNTNMYAASNMRY